MAVALTATLADAVRSPQPAPAAPKPEQGAQALLERPDETAALVTARLTGKPVKIAGMTTEVAEFVAQPDGTIESTVYAAPVRMRIGGKWVPVDLTLKRANDGSVRPVAHPENLSITGARDTASGALATIGAGSEQLAMNWEGKLPEPVLEGNRATYPEVLPEVDLVVEATRTGFEQFLVVKTRAAATRVKEVPLSLSGRALASHTRDAAGSLALRDKSGSVVATSPAPEMWDAQLAEDGETPRRRAAVHVVTTARPARAAAKGQTAVPAGVDLKLAPDTGWLDDPATQFPVTIDPQLSVTTSFDGYIKDGDSGGHSGANDLQIGLLSGTGGKRTRSFINWNTAALRGRQILDATVKLYNFYSTSCSATPWEIWVTGSANASTRWSNQPGWSSKEGTSTQTKGFNSSCGDGWVSISAKSFFQRAATAGWSTSTMGIRASNESATNQFKQFRSRDADNNAQVPQATVKYNSYPVVGARSASPSMPCVTGAGRPYINSLTPQLKAVVSDPDGGKVKATFEWHLLGVRKLGEITTGLVASGSTLTAKVPAGVLADNGNYTWRVSGNDGAVSSPMSSYCDFSVDTTAPNTAPTVNSTDYPADRWAGASGRAGAFTFGSAGVPDVSGYEWGLDNDQPDIFVDAGATGTAMITPTTEGPHVLSVRSRDRAGNRSPITQYTFLVGAGAVTAPHGGDLSSGTTAIEGLGQAAATGVTYQWRRGEADAWQTIPAADVVLAEGNAPVTWPVASTGGGKFAKLNWNLAATLNEAEAGPDPLDGPVQIRATFSGGAAAASGAVKFALDRDRALAQTANVGPGVVNLVTGNFAINRTDTGVGGDGVARTANSRQAATVDPMFGPGWASSVGAPALGVPYTGLSVSGSLVQIGRIAGGSISFAKTANTSTGASFEPQVSFESDSLVYTSATDTYVFTDEEGMSVKFARGTSDPAGKYTVRTVSEAGGTDAVSNTWETATVDGQAVVRPTQVLSPVPDGVSCNTALVRGCSALSFVYATSTTATGGAPEQWGDRVGRVKQITYTTWDPDSTPASMRTVSVAAYAYDSAGRLRSAWDPRLDWLDGAATRHVAESYSYGANGVLNEIRPAGLQPWQFTYTTLPGDQGAGRLAAVDRPTGTALGTARTSVVYHVRVAGAGAPYDLSVAQSKRWGQNEQPVDATAIFPATQHPDGDQAAGVLPSSYERAGISYFDANARTVNAAEPTGQITTTWFDSAGHEVRELTAANREQALDQAPDDEPSTEAATAKSLSTETTYSSDGRRTLAQLDPEHDVVLPDGTTTRGRPYTTYSYDEGAPKADDPFDQVTTETVQLRVWANDGTYFDADKRTKKTQFDWDLLLPLKVTEDAGGLNLVTRYTYDPVTKEQRTVSSPASGGDTTPATERTTYYRSGTGSGVAQCDNHPEWSGLICRVDPGGQPITGSPVPSTVTTYNSMAHPRTVVLSTSAGVLRTTTNRYDLAGRRTETEIAVANGLGEPVAVRRNVFDKGTGLLSRQQEVAANGTVVAEIGYGYDGLGRLISYTDADRNVSTTTYDILDRPMTSSDGKASRTFGYDGDKERSGQVTSVIDSQLGTFSARYNRNGAVIGQSWPNGVQVDLSVNEEDVATRITYTQANCGSDDCTLFSETVAQSVHDQWRSRTSSTSGQEFDYDNGGRLVMVRDTVGGDCATRAYTYDAVANRKSSTAYPSAEDGSCQTQAGGSAVAWDYDSADRLTDTGYTYDALGRNTVQPGKDASNGAGDSTMSFFANDMVRSISQAGRTNTYELDPVANRLRSWTQSGGGTTITKRNHYSNEGDAPTWTDEGDGTYTRSVGSAVGMAGTFRSDGAMTWSLINLHGDVVARMDSNPGLVATADYDEFGVARTAAPNRYGWLGASQRAVDTPNGVLLMGARLYNPATGRFLSRDPVNGGGLNTFEYCGGDPLGCSDESGEAWIDCSGTTTTQRFVQYSTQKYPNYMPYWKTKTERHGKTLNIRCKLSHAATKRLVDYAGPAAGAAIGIYLGSYCLPAAVICMIAGGIVGAVVGAMSASEYGIRCPQEKGITLRATVKARWGKQTIYWRWWAVGGKDRQMTYPWAYAYGWPLGPKCNR